jgi:hypothetical protein
VIFRFFSCFLQKQLMLGVLLVLLDLHGLE